ncbi:MAG: ATP-binding protein [Thermodesulfobacteriota bacterium]|nr:ATP-binding protein [Thermodesulfobacteriota bacterium]
MGRYQTWVFTFLLGTIVLCILSLFQKLMAGYPLTFRGFLVPFLGGGSFGLLIGLRQYRLKDVKNKLQKAHDELEHRVKERTSELMKTNAQLNEEIYERKQAEEALRRSEQFLQDVFDAIQDGISVLDTDLKVIKTNRWMEEIYANKMPLAGKKCYQVYQQRQSPCPWCPALPSIQTGKTHSEIVPYPSKDDPAGWIELFTFPIKDEKGHVTEVIEYVKDITEHKQAEKDKIKNQKLVAEHEKLALVGQIAGKMAHDFNNILGVIMGNTELTLLDCQEPETRKTLELIFEQTIRGKNLTKNLVAFAKDQEPKQEFFRINEKIDLVLNLLKKDLEGIEIIKEVKTGMPDLLADPGMIQHGLVNFFHNSIHALSMVKHPTIIIRTYTMDDNICFEIEDNGCGIPKEHLENIYEPSFTLKGSKDVIQSYKSGIKGTGYGMANVKKYIEQHKGSIFVESESGSGTKFIIKMPIIKKELTAKEKTGLQEEIAHFEKYILLVEDEHFLSDVQYRILTDEPCNHKVDKAENGQIAKDLFDRNKYDFVSLDYVLPGNINGMDVYNHIRKTNKTIPILFISGNIEFLESIKELKQKDAYIDHLSKPCQNKDYVNSINELLKKH